MSFTTETEIKLLADCPETAPIIAKWYFDEWAHKDPEMTLEIVTQKVLLGVNREEAPIAFVAFAKDKLVGGGEIKYRELAEYPNYHYWLDGIYVPAEYRGIGISTLLIQFAIQKAKNMKVSALYLRCEAHNVTLYQARGFKVVTTEGEKFIMGIQTKNQYLKRAD